MVQAMAGYTISLLFKDTSVESSSVKENLNYIDITVLYFWPAQKIHHFEGHCLIILHLTESSISGETLRNTFTVEPTVKPSHAQNLKNQLKVVEPGFAKPHSFSH